MWVSTLNIICAFHAWFHVTDNLKLQTCAKYGIVSAKFGCGDRMVVACEEKISKRKKKRKGVKNVLKW